MIENIYNRMNKKETALSKLREEMLEKDLQLIQCKKFIDELITEKDKESVFVTKNKINYLLKKHF